jgi:predicted Rossmann-fold nucleotide-binding protein
MLLLPRLSSIGPSLRACTSSCSPPTPSSSPRGIGTVLETMMIWQLLQVRHLENTPLILVGKMWPGLIEWASSSMLSFDAPLANPEDMTIPRCAANADEAIAIIREYHGKWLSTRA